MKATSYESPLHHFLSLRLGILPTTKYWVTWSFIFHTLYTSLFTLIPPSYLHFSLSSVLSFVISGNILNLFRISSSSAEYPAHSSFQALPQYCLADTKYQASYCIMLCTSQEYPLSSPYIFTWQILLNHA